MKTRDEKGSLVGTRKFIRYFAGGILVVFGGILACYVFYLFAINEVFPAIMRMSPPASTTTVRPFHLGASLGVTTICLMGLGFAAMVIHAGTRIARAEDDDKKVPTKQRSVP